MKYIRRVLAGAILAVSAASPALANDDFAEPAAERFGWGGPYIGAMGGFTSGPFTYNVFAGGALLGTSTVGGSGGFAGLQAGYDWQFGNFVVGAVADIAWTGHSADLTAAFGLAPGTTATGRLNYLGTTRIRGGYGIDRVLLYAHGGIAFGSSSLLSTGPGATSVTTGRFGWTAGAGAEFRLTKRISIGAEYGYVDLGAASIASAGGVTMTNPIRFHSGKGFINLRF